MIDVVMPQMGESIVEGTLTKWLKGTGEHVERDEPLFEISTDKVDTEIPSPGAGVLQELLVEEGKTVAINTIVARINEGNGASASPDTSPQHATETSAMPVEETETPTPAAQTSAAQGTAPAAANRAQGSRAEPAGAGAYPAQPEPQPAAPVEPFQEPTGPLSPVVRKMAREF